MVQPIAMLITLPLFNVVGEIEQILIRRLRLLAPTTSNGQVFSFLELEFHVPKNMSVATIPIAMLIFTPNSYVKSFLFGGNFSALFSPLNIAMVKHLATANSYV